MTDDTKAVVELTREELVARWQRGEPFHLIDVLPHEHYTRLHLPGSMNVPLPVLRDLAPLLFGHTEHLIVYCANTQCTASTTAAKILLQLGFQYVWVYAAGMQDWYDAGLPVVHRDGVVKDEEKAGAVA